MSSDRTSPPSQNDAAATRDTDAIPKDDAFHLLRNARRRAVLRYLLAHPDREQFRMRDLAEEVAAWEHDTTVEALTGMERQRVYVALYQSHLPKLDDHGVIDYDQDRGRVTPTPRIGALAPFLDDGLHGATEKLTVDGTAAENSWSGVVSTIDSLFPSESE